MPSLLECYSNAGQLLIPGVTWAGLHFTGQQNTDKSDSCDYYWSTTRMSMCAAKMAAPHCTMRQKTERPKLRNYYWSMAQMSMRATNWATPLSSWGHEWDIT